MVTLDARERSRISSPRRPGVRARRPGCDGTDGPRVRNGDPRGCPTRAWGRRARALRCPRRRRGGLGGPAGLVGPRAVRPGFVSDSHLAVVPVSALDSPTNDALAYAATLAPRVIAIHLRTVAAETLERECRRK